MLRDDILKWNVTHDPNHQLFDVVDENHQNIPRSNLVPTSNRHFWCSEILDKQGGWVTENTSNILNIATSNAFT